MGIPEFFLGAGLGATFGGFIEVAIQGLAITPETVQVVAEQIIKLQDIPVWIIPAVSAVLIGALINKIAGNRPPTGEVVPFTTVYPTRERSEQQVIDNNDAPWSGRS